MNQAGDKVFNISLNGKIMETVMYDDFSDALNYAFEEYGSLAKVVKVGEQNECKHFIERIR